MLLVASWGSGWGSGRAPSARGAMPSLTPSLTPSPGPRAALALLFRLSWRLGRHLDERPVHRCFSEAPPSPGGPGQRGLGVRSACGEKTVCLTYSVSSRPGDPGAGSYGRPVAPGDRVGRGGAAVEMWRTLVHGQQRGRQRPLWAPWCLQCDLHADREAPRSQGPAG